MKCSFFVRNCFVYIDDEDTNDYQPSPVPKSKESERFAKDKEDFKRKYKEQIDQVWKIFSRLIIILFILVKISLANSSKWNTIIS